MEPTLPAPHHSPEMGPPIARPEVPLHRGGEIQSVPERQESRERQTGAGAGENSAHTAAQPVATPTPRPMPQIPPNNAVPINDSPAVANDEDIIEKEWVDKAKKVIADTRHDPYLQEQAVSKLQADYLSKRYGKTVKLPEEG